MVAEATDKYELEDWMTDGPDVWEHVMNQLFKVTIDIDPSYYKRIAAAVPELELRVKRNLANDVEDAINVLGSRVTDQLLQLGKPPLSKAAKIKGTKIVDDAIELLTNHPMLVAADLAELLGR
jgi:hypothetical protein